MLRWVKTILQMLLIFGTASFLTFLGCKAKTQDIHPSTTSYTTVDSQRSEGGHSKVVIFPHPEIVLDKTYRNNRFKFEVKYPSIWSMVEEDIRPETPDQGVYIFVGSSTQSSIDYSDIYRIDHIVIFGSVSGIGIPEVGMTIGEFTTNDGIKATTYSRNVDGMINTYYVFEETSRSFAYGARVCVSDNTNEKYNDVIFKILRRIKLTQE